MVGRTSNGRTPTEAVAIVTGGSSAAGRLLAAELARRGFAVVIAYLHGPRATDAAVAEILAAGGVALAVRADVTDELDVERLFDETAAALGAVDVVAHATRHGAAAVNRQAARRLTRGGAIVGVARADALPPAVAQQLCDRDITVNGLAPGIEPPGPDRDIAALVGLLESWRPSPGD